MSASSSYRGDLYRTMVTAMMLQDVLANMLQKALLWNSPAFFDLAIRYNAACDSVDIDALWQLDEEADQAARWR